MSPVATSFVNSFEISVSISTEFVEAWATPISVEKNRFFCAAHARMVRDIVSTGNGRAVGYSPAEMKAGPTLRRHTVPPYGVRKYRAKTSFC